MKKMMVTLILATVFWNGVQAMNNNNNNNAPKNTIKVILSGDQELEVDKKLLEQSVTIANLLEDMQDQDLQKGITLSNISKDVFEKFIVPLLRSVHDNQKTTQI